MPILGTIASSYRAAGSALFLANNRGQVYTSTDAATWTYKGRVGSNYGANFRMYDLFDINGTLYANGGASTQMYSSTDGITWVLTNIPPLSAKDFIYSGGNYLITSNSQFGFSSNGTTWTFNQSLVFDDVSSSIAGPGTILGNGVYVAVDAIGGTGSPPVYISTSTNGTTWTSRTAPHANPAYYGVAYGNATYVVVGIVGGIGAIATSTDAITWTSRTPLETSGGIYTITFGNGKFVTNAYASNKAQYSTNGITWTNTAGLGTTFKISYITYGNGYYVGADQSASSGGLLWYSTDAITWSSVVPNTTADNVYGIVYSTTTSKWHISLANLTYGYSTNLTTWTVGNYSDATKPSTSQSVFGFAYNSAAPLYLLTGAGGFIWTSTDAVAWTSRTSGVSTTIRKALFDGTNYLVTGNSSYFSVSTNGITWTSRTTGIGTTVYGIGYSSVTAQKYAITGGGGYISTSTDTITWTTRTGAIASTMFQIKYLNNVWIAVGNSGAIQTSTDAVTWTSRTSNVTSSLYDVGYFNNTYIAVGALGTTYGEIATSTNAITWTSRTGAMTLSLYAVNYVNNKFVIYGSSETAIPYQTSTDGITWTLQSAPSLCNFSNPDVVYNGLL